MMPVIVWSNLVLMSAICNRGCTFLFLLAFVLIISQSLISHFCSSEALLPHVKFFRTVIFKPSALQLFMGVFPSFVCTSVVCRSMALYVTSIKTHLFKRSPLPRDLDCLLWPSLAILSVFVLSANDFRSDFEFTSVSSENVTAVVTATSTSAVA